MLRRMIGAFLFVVLGLMVQPSPATASHCQHDAVIPLAEGVEGLAVLCENKRGVRAHLGVRHLTPGLPYTVWWIYFDDPQLCEVPGACGDIDFMGENPLGVFGRMDSTVARKHGREWFSGRIGGFEPSPGSQIWYVLFAHEPVDTEDGRHRARQLLTPEDADFPPHLGNLVEGRQFTPAGIVIFNVSAD